MPPIPTKITERLSSGLKKLQPIIQAAAVRDVNEADTVVIIMETLSEVLGYNKFTEITKEHAIKNTYVDLAIVLDGKPQLLIEAKAIGLELKEPHVKQAIDYAANQGIDWVILTNGRIYRVYKVSFGKPIDFEIVIEFNILELSPKNQQHLQTLFLLTREGMTKSMLDEHHSHLQATNRFTFAALILSDPVLEIIRRELRRLTPGLKVDLEEVRQVLQTEVLKREVAEGEKVEEAKKKIRKAHNSQLKARPKAVKSTDDNLEGPAPEGFAPPTSSPDMASSTTD